MADKLGSKGIGFRVDALSSFLLFSLSGIDRVSLRKVWGVGGGLSCFPCFFFRGHMNTEQFHLRGKRARARHRNALEQGKSVPAYRPSEEIYGRPDPQIHGCATAEEIDASNAHLRAILQERE